MRKILIGLLVVNVCLFALDVKVDAHKVKLQKNDIYLKISQSELDLILKERTKNNKVDFVNSKQIKDSKFHVVEYFDTNKNILVETIEVNNSVGVDLEKMYEEFYKTNKLKNMQ